MVGAILLVSLLIGLFGIIFWEVNNVEIRDPTDPTKTTLTTALRCQPLGGYQSFFRFSTNSTTTPLLLYHWVLNVALFCPITLFTLVWAFVLWRRLLTNRIGADEGGCAGMVFVWSRRVVNRVQLVIVTCGLYGVANFPLVTVVLLVVMATPGISELPDREV